MDTRSTWPMFCALLVAACSGSNSIDGFKDIKFGASKEELKQRGFICTLTTCTAGADVLDHVASVGAAHLASASVERGATAFRGCAACHTVKRGGEDGVGPNLWSTVGSKIASSESNFSYSDALLEHAGKTWSVPQLDLFLASPRVFAPGTKMIFAGHSDPQKRADLIAYLNTQTDKPVTLQAGRATEARASHRPEYTLFGMAASVTADLGMAGVETIMVSLELSEEELIQLFTKQYGKPFSFFDKDALGGSLTRTYWVSPNDTAIVVTTRVKHSPLEARLPAELSASGDPYSSAEFLDPRQTRQMLERAKGKSVNANDI